MEKYKCHLQVQKYLKSNFIQNKIYMYTFKSGVVRNGKTSKIHPCP